MHSFAIKTARAGDLIMTAGGSGTIAEQIAAILAGVGQEGAGVLDLALLRVFYRHDAFSAAELMQSLAQALPAGTGCALTLVPVARAGAGDGLLAIEAVAVRGSQGQVRRDVGNRPFLTGVRRGQFLFLGAVTGVQADGIVAESTSVMQQLGATLQALGAGFADVVRMNRWYHAAGTKAEWEPSARAVAAFYAEPGPIATAISLPVPLPAARSIQIELMGMIGEDGRSLPKRHSWPEGLWDWPIHLPYKHGLACGGLGFVGGQVSLDAQAQVIDPDHLDRQVARSLANIDRVVAGFGAAGSNMLHLGAYFELPQGGLHSGQPGAKALLALSVGAVPVALVGFDNLSYPQMRIEIEAIVALQEA